MPIALGYFALGALATGLLLFGAYKANQSNSCSVPTPVDSHKSGLLDGLLDDLENLKTKAILGVVVLISKVYIDKTLEEQSRINNIEDSLEGALAESGDILAKAAYDISGMKGVTNNTNNDIINTRQESVNSIPVDNFWVRTTEDTPSTTGVPAIPKEGPTILDTPASDIPEPSITGFPAIPKEGPQIIDTPADTGVDVPTIWGVPATPKTKSMDDIIIESRAKNPNNEPYLKRVSDLVAQMESDGIPKDCSYEQLCKKYGETYLRTEIAAAYTRYTGNTDQIDNIDFPKILEEDGRPVEEGEHAHHIAYKLGRKGKMREYAQKAKEILKRYGMDDPITDPRNLTSAPNKGHSVENIKEVYETLYKAEQKALSEASDLGLKGKQLNDYVLDKLCTALKKLGEIASNR